MDGSGGTIEQLESVEGSPQAGSPVRLYHNARKLRVPPSAFLLCSALPGLEPIDFDEAIGAFCLTLPLPARPSHCGFSPMLLPEGGEWPVYLLEENQYRILRVTELIRRLPSSAVAARLTEMLSDAEEDLSEADKTILEADLISRMLGEVEPGERDCLLIYHAASGLALICDTNYSAAERARRQLDRIIPELRLEAFELPPTAAENVYAMSTGEAVPPGLIAASEAPPAHEDDDGEESGEAAPLVRADARLATADGFSFLGESTGFIRKAKANLPPAGRGKNATPIEIRLSQFADQAFPAAIAFVAGMGAGGISREQITDHWPQWKET